MRTLEPNEKRQRLINDIINALTNGRTNACTSVTLSAGATSTAINKRGVYTNDGVFLTPMTANAAAEMASGQCYATVTADGTITIYHRNNAQTDRTFSVLYHEVT